MYSCFVRIFLNNQQKVVIDELNNLIKNDGFVLLLFFGLNVKLLFLGMKGKDCKKKNCGLEQMKGYQIVYGLVLCFCFVDNKI